MLQKLNLNIEQMNQNDGSVSYHCEGSVIYGLTNPKHDFWKISPHEEPLMVFYCKEIEPGIYEGGLNFEYDISNYSPMEAYGAYHQLTQEGIPIESYKFEDMINGVSPYGVADNVEQIKQYAKKMIESENPIVISVTEIRKDQEPEEDGWRWHKWGQYIGKQSPQCEYLFDEPHIESVYVFHVYAVRPKLEKNLDNTQNDQTENKRLKM